MTRPNITPGKWSWQGTGKTKNKVLPRLTRLQAYTGSGLAVTVLVVDGEVAKGNPDAIAISALPDLLEALEKLTVAADAHDHWSTMDEVAAAKSALLKAGYTF